MIDLLLHYVILHVCLGLVDVWLSELVFFVLLILNLLQSLKFVQLHFTPHGLGVALPAYFGELIVPVVVLVIHVIT